MWNNPFNPLYNGPTLSNYANTSVNGNQISRIRRNSSAASSLLTSNSSNNETSTINLPQPDEGASTSPTISFISSSGNSYIKGGAPSSKKSRIPWLNNNNNSNTNNNANNNSQMSEASSSYSPTISTNLHFESSSNGSQNGGSLPLGAGLSLTIPVSLGGSGGGNDRSSTTKWRRSHAHHSSNSGSHFYLNSQNHHSHGHNNHGVGNNKWLDNVEFQMLLTEYSDKLSDVSRAYQDMKSELEETKTTLSLLEHVEKNYQEKLDQLEDQHKIDLESLQACHEESVEELSMTIADLLEQKRCLEDQLRSHKIEPITNDAAALLAARSKLKSQGTESTFDLSLKLDDPKFVAFKNLLNSIYHKLGLEGDQPEAEKNTPEPLKKEEVKKEDEKEGEQKEEEQKEEDKNLKGKVNDSGAFTSSSLEIEQPLSDHKSNDKLTFDKVTVDKVHQFEDKSKPLIDDDKLPPIQSKLGELSLSFDLPRIDDWLLTTPKAEEKPKTSSTSFNTSNFSTNSSKAADKTPATSANNNAGVVSNLLDQLNATSKLLDQRLRKKNNFAAASTASAGESRGSATKGSAASAKDRADSDDPTQLQLTKSILEELENW